MSWQARGVDVVLPFSKSNENFLSVASVCSQHLPYTSRAFFCVNPKLFAASDAIIKIFDKFFVAVAV